MSRKEQIIWYITLTVCGIVVVVFSILFQTVFSPIIDWIVHAIGWLMIAGGVIPWCNMNKTNGGKK